MLTKAQAMTYRGTLLHMTAKNAAGLPVRCRVNGACKTWKTRPDEFKLPVKHGLKGCFYITEKEAHMWCTEANYPVESELFNGVTP